MNQHGAGAEGRAARMHVYKEERRRQMTARAAAALSANVTERRQSKKYSERGVSADTGVKLKCSSDLNLDAPSSAVPIRTTRTSRLRAAATVDLVSPTKNTAKTASTLSLDDAGKPKRSSLEKHRTKKIAQKISTKKEAEDKEKADTGIEDVAGASVEKVRRFSELLNNLTSPGEAERMFEDLVAEKSVADDFDFSRLTDMQRSTAPAAPCRRAELHATPPLTASTPRRCDHPPGIPGASTPTSTPTTVNGNVAKSRHRRSLDATAAKTETPLPSSRVSPKCSSTAAKKESPLQSSLESKSPSSSPQSSNSVAKTYNRRESSSKRSLIPLSRRSTESSERKAVSPTKHEPSKEAISRYSEHRFKKDSSIEANASKSSKSSIKAKIDVERNNRFDKAKRIHNRTNETPSEKYHYSKKRLTSLDNSKDTNGVRKNSPKRVLNDGMQAELDIKNSEVSILKTEDMSTAHENAFHARVRPHADHSRLSQRLDSLEARTKQTLDRVYKLSNDDRIQNNENNLDAADAEFDTLFASASNTMSNGIVPHYGQARDKTTSRGVTERLRDIDTAAQRLIDFEKQSAMYSFCDLKNDTSQNRRNDYASSSSVSHTPVSILKRKSIQDEIGTQYSTNHAISTPPVTFSPSVVDPLPSRSDNRQKQGILKKRRSLDESQVSRRSCSPEVSFADDGSSDANKSILKNRRSSLEDVVRTHSPDGQIQGILKRKMSREEELHLEDTSLGSPEPHGILKRKSNSSSSSSTASSHVSIAQAVILAAAGGAEIVEDDKDAVRPILKKKSFSEERPCPETVFTDGPKPILKKKSLTECEDYEFDRPKKPILKTSKKLSSEDGNASSFELSEDDRSSRRPSLLKSRTSDYSGSECETTVKPILKQRCSSLTRERSQSPRPRLSFCADNDSSVTNFSTDASDALPATPQRVNNTATSDQDNLYPTSVLKRRNLRPRAGSRSKSLVCEVNAELLSILNDRRLKVDENCDRSIQLQDPEAAEDSEAVQKVFPSIAARIKIMERHLGTKETNDKTDNPPVKSKRDRDRYKTQPITLEEMESASSSLEPGQTNFQPFGPVGVGSFPSRFAAGAGARAPVLASEEDVGTLRYCLDSTATNGPYDGCLSSGYGASGESKLDSSSSSGGEPETACRVLDQLQSEVARVLVELDADCRALDRAEDERQQADADSWSLNVSCDSGVYNRASSRDSAPHSGEELGLIDTEEMKESRASNSGGEMEREGERENEVERENCRFQPGLVKSNSVVARASMWQQLQQQARGIPRPLIRHSRSKSKELASAAPAPATATAERFTAPAVPWRGAAHRSIEAGSGGSPPAPAPAHSTTCLDRDEEAKLDEDDPAKMSLGEKMKMFNSRLNYKPPAAGGACGRAPRKEERTPRSKRLKTMPVLASQLPPPPPEDERLCKSYTNEDIPRDSDFQRKMALFRSASLRNTSLKYVMEQNEKNRSLEVEAVDCGRGQAERTITPEVRGILKAGATAAPRHTQPIAKGESSEGLEDEGINSSSDEESASASSVSSSEKSCSSSSSSDELPEPATKRSPPKYLKSNALKSSRTDSDIARVLKDSYPAKKDPYPTRIKLPCLNEMKDRLNRVQREAEKKEDLSNQLGKLNRQPTKEKENVESEECKNRFLKKRFGKNVDEPILLGKLRRPADRSVASTQSLDEPSSHVPEGVFDAKKRLSGHFDERKPERTLEEITAAVRKYIPQVNKSASLAALSARLASELREEFSGSDGESSGGREVRHINTRRNKHRSGGVAVAGGGGGGAGGGGFGAGCGIQRSATHGDMPHRGGTTIAERLAALQAAGANDWRSRVCRLSPEQDDTKAIERAKNRINDQLTAAVDDNKKAQIDENELGSNILADRRNKLETAAQGWRKRVPQTDAALFSVAGRLERDKAAPAPGTPPPPPLLTPPSLPASPGVPPPNKFRSRKQQSPPHGGLGGGPLRSASCAAVGALSAPAAPAAVPASLEAPAAAVLSPAPAPRARDNFKRSQSVTDNMSKPQPEDSAGGQLTQSASTCGASVPVPRADDETFTAFFKSASSTLVNSQLLINNNNSTTVIDDADLDAIDTASRQMLVSNGVRRARLVNRRAASRNPLRALAARTDLRAEYTEQLTTGVVDREQKRINLEKAASGCGLAAEALAALAAKEDFASVALRTAGSVQPGATQLPRVMLLQVKGRRRVQTRLVEPVHTNVNRGDCFVLVTHDQVFHYMGYYSNVIERSRGTDVALHIHNNKDLGCKNSTGVITIDEQSKNRSNKHWNQFWGLLGAPLDRGEFHPIEAGHADEDEIFESTIIQTNMCYELTDDELIPIKEFWGQVPKISMLSPSKVIVFDFGTEMYIWNGKNVPLDRRRLAAQLAQEMFDEGYNYEECHVNPLIAAAYQGIRIEPSVPIKTSKSRPEWAVVTKVTQHMENILFKEKFLDWPDFTRVIKVKHQENKTNYSEITPCDPEEMLANEYEEPDLILEGSHIGRGTQYYDKETMRHYDIKTKSVSKWIIQESDYQKIDTEYEMPEFYSGDSYIIRWEYQITATGRELNGKPSKHNMTGRDRCAYFCWQGKDASSNEKGTAALLTVELDKEKGPQVRVTQGNEPPAFLNLFHGNLIVHQGKRDSDKSRFRLYVTRGNITNESYLLQVPCSMRQLRSRGSLLLVDTERGALYIWHGVRSLKHSKQVAIDLANKLIARKSTSLFGAIVGDLKVEEIKEGEEPKGVLDALGGANRQFYHSLLKAEPIEDVTPRLFHFTDLGGQFEANEVLSPLRHTDLVTPFPFEQKELYSASQPALFMLDDGKSVWLWQGWWPNAEGDLEPAERNAGVGAFAARWQAMRGAALASCAGYWRAARRGASVDVRLVVAGLEPLSFSNLFDSWQDRDDIAELNMHYGYKAGETLSGVCELSRLNSSSDVVLPLAALQQRPLPEDVHPHHLERHLSTSDFQEAFGMGKEEFAELPAWKQTNLKKELGLF